MLQGHFTKIIKQNNTLSVSEGGLVWAEERDCVIYLYNFYLILAVELTGEDAELPER